MIDYSDFELLAVELLLLASVVAIAARYLRIPYTVALVLAGFLISFVHVFDVALSREIILLVFLPPLLFEGAINMNLLELRKRWLQVLLLAVPGTLITVAVVAGGLIAFTNLPLEFALLLAVMLAPTDPVSVLATMKEHGVSGGLRTLLEGESVFNDAIGIVLFAIALEFAFPGHADEGINYLGAIGEFGKEVVIGVGVGLGMGLLIHRLMRRLDDHLVEITLSVSLAFGSYLVADRLHGSGVLAVVVGGLLIGNYGHYANALSAASQRAVAELWEVVAFLLNSALFLLIGLEFELDSLVHSSTLIAGVVAVFALLAGRAIAIYGLMWPFRASRGSSSEAIPVTWMHASYWGGLRGSIPIALVLGLTAGERDFAGVDPVAVVFGVVMLSLVGQGLTFAPLLRKLHLTARRGGPA